MKKIYKFIEIFRWEEEERKGGRTRKNKKKLVGGEGGGQKKINIFFSIQYSIYKKYELKINQNKKRFVSDYFFSCINAIPTNLNN